MPKRGPEAILQADLNNYAWRHGWRYLHIPPSHRGGVLATQTQGQNGWPDFVALRIDPRDNWGVRLIVAELKSGRRQPTAEQQAWLDAFRGAGARVYVWRETNIEEIKEVLCEHEPKCKLMSEEEAL